MSLRVKSLYRQRDSIVDTSLLAKDYIKNTFRKSLKRLSSNPQLNKADTLLNPVQTTPLPVIEDLDFGYQFSSEFHQFKAYKTPKQRVKELTPEWMRLADPILVSPVQIPPVAPHTQLIEQVPNLSNDSNPSTPATLTTNPSHDPPELVISPHPQIATVPLAILLKPVAIPSAIDIDSEGRTLLQSPNPPRPTKGTNPPQLPSLDNILNFSLDMDTLTKEIDTRSNYGRTASMPNLLFISNTNESNTGYTFVEGYPKVPKLQPAPKMRARGGSCHLPNPTGTVTQKSKLSTENGGGGFIQKQERRLSSPEIGNIRKLQSLHSSVVQQRSHPVSTVEYSQNRQSKMLEKEGIQNDTNGGSLKDYKGSLKSVALISRVKDSLKVNSIKIRKGVLGELGRRMSIKDVFS